MFREIPEYSRFVAALPGSTFPRVTVRVRAGVTDMRGPGGTL